MSTIYSSISIVKNKAGVKNRSHRLKGHIGVKNGDTSREERAKEEETAVHRSKGAIMGVGLWRSGATLTGHYVARRFARKL